MPTPWERLAQGSILKQVIVNNTNGPQWITHINININATMGGVIWEVEKAIIIFSNH